MESFTRWLKDNRRLLRTIEAVASENKVSLYLVGGVLRDLFLKKIKANPDFDFCLKNNSINFARRVAGRMKAGFVVLDQEHGCARVVKKETGRIVTLDFSDFRGKTLEDDLRLRDFTINSMAVALGPILKGAGLEESLIDLYGGRSDLAKGIIKAVYPRAFDDDPLRILRAFSHSAAFGFKIDPRTIRVAVSKKKKLSSVSAERVRDELFKILASGESGPVIAELDKFGILELIFPELREMKRLKKRSAYRLDVWAHTKLTFENTERIAGNFKRSGRVRDYLEQEISSGRRRAELLKLAALLHDVGKPKTFRVVEKKVQFHGHERLGAQMVSGICSRLRLSNEELRIIKRIVFLHLRPGYLVTNPVLSAKAKFRFFRDAGEDAGSILLLALADERATRGYLLLDKIRKKYERVIPALIRQYFAREKEGPAKRLVDGNEIMKFFRLEPSPLIGKVLKSLEELQAIGKIRTQKEALEAAAAVIKNV